MAHFAEIDENNIVQRVIVIDNALEENGVEWCTENLGGRWIQTSYNNNFRKQFAGIGYSYDEEKDIFIAIKPFESWILDDDSNWVAPKPYPNDENSYYWDEITISWIVRGE
jgi:hypothetical protein